MPERAGASSLSMSVVLAEPSFPGVDDGAGRSKKMLGAPAPCSALRGENTEGLIEVADGGGDFNLGDVGQRGEFSPVPPLLDFLGLGVSPVGSEVVGLAIGGVPIADKARCTAAAEGTDGWMEPLGARFGLRSWLLSREAVALAEGGIPGFIGGRIGEVSREVFGEFFVDVALDPDA